MEDSLEVKRFKLFGLVFYGVKVGKDYGFGRTLKEAKIDGAKRLSKDLFESIFGMVLESQQDRKELKSG